MSIDEDMRRICLAANIECNRQMREGAAMSEVFDPENIIRYTAFNFTTRSEGDKQAGMVTQEDYDSLLALYREAVFCPTCGHKRHYALRCGAREAACECISF